MIFFWLGIFFFTSMGTFLYPIYGMDNSGGWPILLGAGIVSNIIGCYRTRMDSLSHINLEGDAHSGILRSFIINRQSSILFLIPLGIGIYAFCFPYSLPLYVWVVAILLGFFSRWRCLSPICSGVLLSGLILVFQTACIIPYFKLAARLHEINLFYPILLLDIQGVRGSVRLQSGCYICPDNTGEPDAGYIVGKTRAVFSYQFLWGLWYFYAL